MTTSSITFAQILVIAPEDAALPKDIIGRLEHAWGEFPAIEIGAKSTNPAEMATDLLALLPDPAYNNATRVAVVEALGRLLKQFNLVPVEPKQPLKVVFDKTPGQMNLRELLEALIADPSSYPDLRPYIESNHRVQRPSQRSKGLWVIPGIQGGIDIDLTLDYISYLDNQFAVPQNEFRGRRPVTLDRALGINNRALIHPFTGHPVQGLDENGFDLSQLSDPLHEALLWAAVTKHSAWPQQITDLYGFTEQLFQSPLATRWQRIVADYSYAKETGDDLTRIISRYWPENVSLQGVLDITSAFGAQPQRGQRLSGNSVGINFRQLVEDAANLNGKLDINGTNVDYNGGVYKQLSVRGTNIDLKDVVVTKGGSINGTNVDGNLLLPPGVRVSVKGTNVDVTQVNLSWEDLARKLRLI